MEKDDEDLTIPAHLRRGPPDKEMTNRLLKHELHREWKMPTGDYSMAKTPEIETNDAALPVEVHCSPVTGDVEIVKFDNLQEFIDWYDVKKYDLDGSIAEDTKTMISLHEKAPPPEKAATLPDGHDGEVENVGETIQRVEKAVKGKGGSKRKAAPKAPAKAKGPPVARGAVVKDAERSAKPRGVNFVRHGVKVNGEPYGSVYKAFVALKLSIPAHTKFRAALKQSKTGKDTYKEKGKDYKFELVELK